ncbi:hypothetical protein [Luteibacter anthropi]|uniref:Uncharacterized protein n=1 Tax=Luteibacter anthropi TaxID=564369 RepID=A0A7X5ZJI6_9GAMM|nr:hypothetical protein [Luteibacter anthropi]NII07972.1 hypothetical protein [Luteibacter anthropi]
MKSINSRYAGCVLAVIISAVAPHARAGVTTNLGHISGAQCVAVDINDTGTAAGVCTPGSVNLPTVPWIAMAGAEVSLTVPVAGKACGVSGISNSGSVIGQCDYGNNQFYAVTWAGSGASPLKLAPLSGLLGLASDVSSRATAYNDQGFVGGQSVGAAPAVNSTAVVWAPNSATATQVSSAGDNCVLSDVQSGGSGNPTVVVNCPTTPLLGTTITNQPKVATWTGVGYTMTVLPNPPLPAGAPPANVEQCMASSINASGQVLGTCRYDAPPRSRAVRWSGSPLVGQALTLAAGGNPVLTVGAAMNDAGHVVYAYQDVNGKSGVGYWEPGTGKQLLVPRISPGGPGVQANSIVLAGFGSNDRIVINGETGDGHIAAASIDPTSASPSLIVEPLLSGGSNEIATAVSKSGAVAAGSADDGTHESNAVVYSLP